MSVVPMGPLSETIAAVDAALAGLAAWRSLLGAADVAAAQARMLWQYGPLEAELPPPFATLGLREWSERTPALGARRASGVFVEAYVVWPELYADGDTARDVALRATNAWGAILIELANTFGAGGSLTPADRQLLPPQPCAPGIGFDGCWEALLTLTWRS